MPNCSTTTTTTIPHGPGPPQDGEVQRLVGRLVRSVDNLLVLSGGRSVCSSTNFGVFGSSGACGKLIRNVIDILNHGSVPCSSSTLLGYSSSNCIPFIQSALSKAGLRDKDIPQNDSELLRFFSDRLIDSNIAETLAVILDKRELIRNFYDIPACIGHEKVSEIVVASLFALEARNVELINELKLNVDHGHLCDATSTLSDLQRRLIFQSKAKPLAARIALFSDQNQLLPLINNEGKVLAPRETLIKLEDNAIMNTTVEDKSSNSSSGVRPKNSTLASAVASSDFEVNQSTKRENSLPRSFSQTYSNSKQHLDVYEGIMNNSVPNISSMSVAGNNALIKKTHKRSTSDTAAIQIRSEMIDSISVDELKRLSFCNSSESLSAESSSMMFDVAPPSPPVGGWSAPKPASMDQSLASYIASGDFSCHQAQLDRENAHLILSEAVIQGLNKSQFEKKIRISAKLPSTFKTQGEKRQSSSYSRPSTSATSSSCPATMIAGPSLREETGNGTSAETLALTLLTENGGDANGPRVSDLLWLVGDDDTPQKVIPLPNSFSPESSPQSNVSLMTSELRGSFNWAPPRPQLIFEIHTKKKLTEAMREQNFLCRGCGVAVDSKYMKKFRYCNYFGAFFCTSCHSNQESVLPAKIIHKWNFKEEPVSDFARSVIFSISRQKLFNPELMNPGLVKRIAKLRRAIDLSYSASVIFPFILACKSAEEDGIRERIEEYDFTKPGEFSLNDLCSIQSGTFNKNLLSILEAAKTHIFTCKLCHLHGHICEGCRSSDILFPFQKELVVQCQFCKACYHNPCFKNLGDQSKPCSKCERIKERKLRKQSLEAEEQEIISLGR